MSKIYYYFFLRFSCINYVSFGYQGHRFFFQQSVIGCIDCKLISIEFFYRFDIMMGFKQHTLFSQKNILLYEKSAVQSHSVRLMSPRFTVSLINLEYLLKKLSSISLNLVLVYQEFGLLSLPY